MGRELEELLADVEQRMRDWPASVRRCVSAHLTLTYQRGAVSEQDSYRCAQEIAQDVSDNDWAELRQFCVEMQRVQAVLASEHQELPLLLLAALTSVETVLCAQLSA